MTNLKTNPMNKPITNPNKYTLALGKTIAALLLATVSFAASAKLKTETIVQLHVVDSSGTESWLERGTGQTRYDNHDDIELGQALFVASYDISSSLSVNSVLNYQTEQDAGLGVSQLYLKYKPVWSPKYRPTFKAGVFYPEFSYENAGAGWLSPYTYSFSTINSWIAEEQRTAGVEASVAIGSGRDRHRFNVTGAIYKGNDTLGTMLAWRGWAVHDKQSVVNEILFFDTYPSLGPNGDIAPQAAWGEPSREIDGRFGFYLGGEWNYRRKSRLRYFYYDNNGDIHAPRADGGQFAWDTKYHSLAWQYRFDKSWRVLAQTIRGNSAMWHDKVEIDFMSSYVMLNYANKQHLASLRLEQFETVDKDAIASDDNNGDGQAMTIAYKYTLNEAWKLGAEYTLLDGFRASRAQWPGRATNVEQNQLLLVAEFRY